MQELYTFMASANATLDASLEDDAGPLSAMASLRTSSLPPSAKATPRGLPSTEVGSAAGGWRLGGWGAPLVPAPELSRLAILSHRLPHLQSSSAMSRLASTLGSVLDPEAAKLAAEEARRAKLYGIMACIREVQKRNDRTGALPAPARGRAVCRRAWGGGGGQATGGRSSALALHTRRWLLLAGSEPMPALHPPIPPQRRCSSRWRTRWRCWAAAGTSWSRSWSSSWRTARASGACCTRRCSGGLGGGRVGGRGEKADARRSLLLPLLALRHA